MDIHCDSGYGSAEGENDEVMESLEESINDGMNNMEDYDQDLEQMTEGFLTPVEDTEKEDDDYDDESFQDWLKRVAECLEGRKKGDPEKMDHFVTEKLTEEERCMKIARSVLDEETVLEMVKTFLQFTKVILLRVGGSSYVISCHIHFRNKLFLA